ncbi:LGFP repeat-containing protein [Nocardioides massiliensis]|nr:hypothetical protein [Nocardioides massiliensis]
MLTNTVPVARPAARRAPRLRRLLAGAAGMALALTGALPLAAAPAPAAAAPQVVHAKAKFAPASYAVTGPIGKRYRKLGGANGRLGAPIGPQRCHKPTGVCSQRFKRGAIIHDRDAIKKVVHAFGKPQRAAYLAVARAYVGYREPRVRGSKWNEWIGNDRAWCGFFNAWVSRASLNGNRYPKADHYTKQIAVMRQRGTMLKKPQRGAFMFIDRVGNGKPAHGGLIVRVKKNGDVVTIDGNAPHPKSNTRKGRRYVVQRSQDTSQAVMYWRPPGW